MSFGVSVSDAILLTQLAARAVGNTRKACGEYAELTKSVSNLSVVLDRLEAELRQPNRALHSNESYQEELKFLTAQCKVGLEELNKVVDKYNALRSEGKGSHKLWKQVKFGNGEVVNIETLKNKLVYYTSALTLYINMIVLGCVGRVEKQMDDAGGDLKDIKVAVNNISAQIQANNRHEESILTDYPGDDKTVWKDLRRELVRDGFSSEVIQRRKRTIIAYFKELGERGILDDVEPLSHVHRNVKAFTPPVKNDVEPTSAVDSWLWPVPARTVQPNHESQKGKRRLPNNAPFGHSLRDSCSDGARSSNKNSSDVSPTLSQELPIHEFRDGLTPQTQNSGTKGTVTIMEQDLRSSSQTQLDKEASPSSKDATSLSCGLSETTDAAHDFQAKTNSSAVWVFGSWSSPRTSSTILSIYPPQVFNFLLPWLGRPGMSESYLRLQVIFDSVGSDQLYTNFLYSHHAFSQLVEENDCICQAEIKPTNLVYSVTGLEMPTSLGGVRLVKVNEVPNGSSLSEIRSYSVDEPIKSLLSGDKKLGHFLCDGLPITTVSRVNLTSHYFERLEKAPLVQHKTKWKNEWKYRAAGPWCKSENNAQEVQRNV
ncbi:uncharacterized protein KY384_008580 [Bacidia gigantensis]|uniref:uncharacterized protein n=1 Tax=Bacidia gigantensis TaxID=2732470 RepID=UPI001D03DA84|nr:uncharacterized protein KY384_008580 [Bacidia gigantensis]KAG8527150.1 hypothetical protein KY384_008580 [Bacidia gigantensis]